MPLQPQFAPYRQRRLILRASAGTCRVHHYVFTVYALDKELEVVSASANFPANSETLYQALIKAGAEGHILARGELVALNEGSLPP